MDGVEPGDIKPCRLSDRFPAAHKVHLMTAAKINTNAKATQIKITAKRDKPLDVSEPVLVGVCDAIVEVDTLDASSCPHDTIGLREEMSDSTSTMHIRCSKVAHLRLAHDCSDIV